MADLFMDHLIQITNQSSDIKNLNNNHDTQAQNSPFLILDSDELNKDENKNDIYE